MESGSVVPNGINSDEKKGLLVAFEGLDGAGKTTQRGLFKTWLLRKGEEVAESKWNTSPLFKPLMDARKAARSLTAMESATLQASDLQHRFDTEIVPQLHQGKIVLADRYVFAGVARDVARGFQRDWSLKLYAPFQLPDMVFYFSVSAQTCAKRISAVRDLDYYDAGQDVTGLADPFESYQRFATKMIAEYIRLSQEFAFIVVNAERPIEEQQRFIQEAFEQKVASFRPDRVAYWDPPSLNQAQPSL